MQHIKAVHLIITNMIRLILFLTFIYALTSERTLVQVVSIIALLTTFIPSTLEKLFNIKIPSSFEIIYLMFIYGFLMLGELRGFYHGLWWWNILMTFTAYSDSQPFSDGTLVTSGTVTGTVVERDSINGTWTAASGDSGSEEFR